MVKIIIDKVPALTYLYKKLYVPYVHRKRRKVKIEGKEYNRINIPDSLLADDLHIVIHGRNNYIEVGSNCKFYRSNSFFIQGDNNRLIIGDNVSFDQNTSIVLAEGTICEIGAGCMFANGVRIRTSDQHHIYDINGNRINEAKNVKIGSNVWIGASVIVMKGATIGNGCIIGINSMVLKDIPPYSIAVGSPAKVVKENVSWKC